MQGKSMLTTYSYKTLKRPLINFIFSGWRGFMVSFLLVSFDFVTPEGFPFTISSTLNTHSINFKAAFPGSDCNFAFASLSLSTLLGKSWKYTVGYAIYPTCNTTYRHILRLLGRVRWMQGELMLDTKTYIYLSFFGAGGDLLLLKRAMLHTYRK